MNLEDLLMYQTDLLAVESGQTLFAAGDSGERMFVLLSGTADIIVNGRVVESAGTGAVIGEMALIDREPRSATVVTTSDCNLLAINGERFAELVRELPQFAIYVMTAMAERLRRSDKLL